MANTRRLTRKQAEQWTDAALAEILGPLSVVIDKPAPKSKPPVDGEVEREIARRLADPRWQHSVLRPGLYTV